MPARHVQHGRGHAAAARGALHPPRVRVLVPGQLVLGVSAGVRGRVLAEAAQHVRLGVLQGPVGGAAVRVGVAAGVAQAVPDVDVSLGLLLLLQLLAQVLDSWWLGAAVPLLLGADPLPPLAANVLEPLPPGLGVVVRGGGRGGRGAQPGLVEGRGGVGAVGGGGLRPRDGRQRADVVQTLELSLEVLGQLLPLHGDAADGAHRLVRLEPLAGAGQVLGRLLQLGLEQQLGAAGDGGQRQEGVGEGEAGWRGDEAVGHGGLGAGEPGLLQRLQGEVGPGLGGEAQVLGQGRQSGDHRVETVEMWRWTGI